jgi:hypothetical protein
MYRVISELFIRNNSCEIEIRGFRVSDLVRRFEKQFEVFQHYSNLDWNPNYNFIMESKYNAK